MQPLDRMQAWCDGMQPLQRPLLLLACILTGAGTAVIPAPVQLHALHGSAPHVCCCCCHCSSDHRHDTCPGFLEDDPKNVGYVKRQQENTAHYLRSNLAQELHGGLVYGGELYAVAPTLSNHTRE